MQEQGPSVRSTDPSEARDQSSEYFRKQRELKEKRDARASGEINLNEELDKTNEDLEKAA